MVYYSKFKIYQFSSFMLTKQSSDGLPDFPVHTALYLFCSLMVFIISITIYRFNLLPHTFQFKFIMSEFEKTCRKQIRIDIMRTAYCINCVVASSLISFMLIKKPFLKLPWNGMILPSFLTSFTYSAIIFGSVNSMKNTRKMTRSYVLPQYYKLRNDHERFKLLALYNMELDEL